MVKLYLFAEHYEELCVFSWLTQLAINRFLLTVLTMRQKQRWICLPVFWIYSHKKEQIMSSLTPESGLKQINTWLRLWFLQMQPEPNKAKWAEEGCSLLFVDSVFVPVAVVKGSCVFVCLSQKAEKSYCRTDRISILSVSGIFTHSVPLNAE